MKTIMKRPLRSVDAILLTPPRYEVARTSTPLTGSESGPVTVPRITSVCCASSVGAKHASAITVSFMANTCLERARRMTDETRSPLISFGPRHARFLQREAAGLVAREQIHDTALAESDHRAARR